MAPSLTIAQLRAALFAHRAFARRSVRDYATRLKNAEHYALARLDDGATVIEPLAWVVLLARGGDIIQSTRGDALAGATLSEIKSLGLRQISPQDADFDAAWQELLDWCARKQTSPSARTDRTAREDRHFWLIPDD